MKHKLTEEEQAIENDADQLVSVDKETRGRVKSIINSAKKNRAISLRISDFDLDMLKKRADAEGLPYQTLINAVLHKYVTDQLFDKNELHKILAGIEETKTLL